MSSLLLDRYSQMIAFCLGWLDKESRLMAANLRTINANIRRNLHLSVSIQNIRISLSGLFNLKLVILFCLFSIYFKNESRDRCQAAHSAVQSSPVVLMKPLLSSHSRVPILPFTLVGFLKPEAGPIVLPTFSPPQPPWTVASLSFPSLF